MRLYSKRAKHVKLHGLDSKHVCCRVQRYGTINKYVVRDMKMNLLRNGYGTKTNSVGSFFFGRTFFLLWRWIYYEFSQIKLNVKVFK